MAVIHLRHRADEASSWEACMPKSYCKWPVVAGIVIGGLLLVPIVWCCARLICCHALRRRGRRGPKGPQNSKQPSVFHPPPSQGYKPAPQPPPYESPKSSQLNCDNQGKVIQDTPYPLPGKAPDYCRDEDVELERLDPAHAPKASMLAHQEPTPVARLSPINTRNLHHSVHRPHDSLQHPFSSQHTSHDSLHASHSSLHAQNPFSDPLAIDCPTHDYRPPSPPRPFSPFVPQRSYSPYSPQSPYSPYSPYSPVSPYTTGATKYESSMFVEHQQPYRAYSPSVSTHYEPSTWNEPVELPSPYNKRPESLVFAQGSQTQLVDDETTSVTLHLHPQSETSPEASPTQPESKDTVAQEQQPQPKQPSIKITSKSQPQVNPLTDNVPPPRRTSTQGRAL